MFDPADDEETGLGGFEQDDCACEGWGTCPECDGTGQDGPFDCFKCEGTGDCPECDRGGI